MEVKALEALTPLSEKLGISTDQLLTMFANQGKLELIPLIVSIVWLVLFVFAMKICNDMTKYAQLKDKEENRESDNLYSFIAILYIVITFLIVQTFRTDFFPAFNNYFSWLLDSDAYALSQILKRF